MLRSTSANNHGMIRRDIFAIGADPMLFKFRVDAQRCTVRGRVHVQRSMLCLAGLEMDCDRCQPRLAGAGHIETVAVLYPGFVCLRARVFGGRPHQGEPILPGNAASNYAICDLIGAIGLSNLVCRSRFQSPIFIGGLAGAWKKAASKTAADINVFMSVFS